MSRFKKDDTDKHNSHFVCLHPLDPTDIFIQVHKLIDGEVTKEGIADVAFGLTQIIVDNLNESADENGDVAISEFEARTYLRWAACLERLGGMVRTFVETAVIGEDPVIEPASTKKH